MQPSTTEPEALQSRGAMQKNERGLERAYNLVVDVSHRKEKVWADATHSISGASEL